MAKGSRNLSHGHVGLGQAQFLALVEEDGSPQAEQRGQQSVRVGRPSSPARRLA